MVCACVLVMTMSHNKMAELIEIPFGRQTCTGQRNHALDEGLYGIHVMNAIELYVLLLPLL